MRPWKLDTVRCDAEEVGVGGTGHEHVCQQALVPRRRQRLRLDQPGVGFEHPVAAQRGLAGEVIGRRHVGADQIGQLVDEFHTGFAIGHVAAVEQQVGTRCQRTPPAAQHLCRVGQVAVVQAAIAQAQRAAAAVAHHVHRRHALEGLQQLADLGQPIPVGVEQHNQGIDGSPVDSGRLAVAVGRAAGAGRHIRPEAWWPGHVLAQRGGRWLRRPEHVGQQALVVGK